jgi:hypothetical protein
MRESFENSWFFLCALCNAMILGFYCAAISGLLKFLCQRGYAPEREGSEDSE